MIMKQYRPKDGCYSIWLLVTPDKYELPVIVADSAVELAKRAGVTPNTIYCQMAKCKRKGKPCRYKNVRVPLDE